MKAFLRGVITLLAATVSLKDCGNPSTDQAVITGYGFSPSNPLAGDPTELWVAYNLKTPITGGTATYSVNLNGIPFTPTVDDLCTQTGCPKEVGTYNETSQSTFPSGVSGKITTKIQWKNQNAEPVWCLESTFKI
jgi:hypothetical protein